MNQKRLYSVINRSHTRGTLIVATSKREAQRIFYEAGHCRHIDNAWARDVTDKYRPVVQNFDSILSRPPGKVEVLIGGRGLTTPAV